MIVSSSMLVLFLLGFVKEISSLHQRRDDVVERHISSRQETNTRCQGTLGFWCSAAILQTPVPWQVSSQQKSREKTYDQKLNTEENGWIWLRYGWAQCAPPPRLVSQKQMLCACDYGSTWRRTCVCFPAMLWSLLNQYMIHYKPKRLQTARLYLAWWKTRFMDLKDTKSASFHILLPILLSSSVCIHAVVKQQYWPCLAYIVYQEATRPSSIWLQLQHLFLLSDSCRVLHTGTSLVLVTATTVWGPARQITAFVFAQQVHLHPCEIIIISTQRYWTYSIIRPAALHYDFVSYLDVVYCNIGCLWVEHQQGTACRKSSGT